MSIFSYYEQKCFRTPLGSTVAFARPRLAYIIPLIAFTGMRRAAGERQPAAVKHPFYNTIDIIQY